MIREIKLGGKKLYKIHTSGNCSSYFFFLYFFLFFFLLKILKFLIPRHFSRESVDPSIKFSNLPIKSFHYKSIIRSIVSRFHLRGFYPKNHTARQFSASCYELQNRDARPSDRGIFRMEQWTVAQKGWRDIGEGKRICVGGYERERERERVSDSSPVISGQSKTRFRSIVVDTAFHAALSSHWRKRYSTWYNARPTRVEHVACDLLWS